MRIRRIILRVIFFLGWLLSPLTFWNDVFINIPISYIMANLFIRIWPINFLAAVVASYWASNIIGILLMYLSGMSIAREGGSLRRELIKFFAAMAVYSIIIILLGLIGVLRPV